MSVLAQLRLLPQESLARAHQVPSLFQFHIEDADNTHKAIGIVLRRLPRINAIGSDLSVTRNVSSLHHEQKRIYFGIISYC